MRGGFKRLRFGASRGGGKTRATNEELLAAIWAALNIARDYKALVVATDGAIINVNQLAAQLCGRTAQELIGKSVLTELFDGPSAPHGAGTIERWEADLKAPSGTRIPVEVTYEPLSIGRQELE